MGRGAVRPASRTTTSLPFATTSRAVRGRSGIKPGEVPGVVDTGLFLGMADLVLVGGERDVQRLTV